MLKIKKKNNPKCGQLFAIRLGGKGHFALAQLICLFEHEGYFATTYAFYDVKCESASLLLEAIPSDLSKPFMVATVDVDPLKEWTLIDKRDVTVALDEVRSKLSTWGWYRHSESGLFGTLECFFGIYPWDMLVGSASLEELTFDNKPSRYARFLSDFTIYEIEALGIKSIIEYAGRLDELKAITDA